MVFIKKKFSETSKNTHKKQQQKHKKKHFRWFFRCYCVFFGWFFTDNPVSYQDCEGTVGKVGGGLTQDLVQHRPEQVSTQTSVPAPSPPAPPPLSKPHQLDAVNATIEKLSARDLGGAVKGVPSTIIRC